MSIFIKNERTGKMIEYPPYQCKLCGMYEVKHIHDICDVCGWEDDSVQNDKPDYEGGANYINYNQYKSVWLNHKEEIMSQSRAGLKGRLVKEIFRRQNNKEET
ncbi:MAG: hypothetical protein FWE84_01300 [Firmicutes bacterium]|nr:hypothetical protein [Bacillota bacterium]